MERISVVPRQRLGEANQAQIAVGERGNFGDGLACSGRDLERVATRFAMHHVERLQALPNRLQHPTPRQRTVARQELSLERKLSGEEHPFVANSFHELGCVLRDSGKWTEAEAMFRKALGMRRGLQFGCGDCPEQFVRVLENRPQELPKCTGTGDRPQGLPKCTGSVTALKGRHLYGFGDRPQGSLSGITTPCIVRGHEENTVALVALLGSIVPPHRSNGD